MTKFRPCIDLHSGVVKQIVGGTLSNDPAALHTNFVAEMAPAEYARLYHDNGLIGGHIIKLGAGNDDAALSAVAAWPAVYADAMHVGGGINDANAEQWIVAGAEKVIVTSFLFPDASFSLERLRSVSQSVGRHRLVVDLSCRRRDNRWVVAMNKWQTLTDMEVTQDSISLISQFCSEFLIHAADVEGLCNGIDEDLVQKLGEWVSIPTTYAGGAKHIDDLDLVNTLSHGKVDLTYGSALDIFGGTQVKFDQLVEWNRKSS
ncbi:hypothetical protein E3P92_02339 [Wallemia ichthyophaga]|uniref:1-(5-phosphoribosyl)-5-[(5-phosphoribosylamino)methylideneamino] imidazole-4-carboxamide isomerase n=1 Tax=Wallemia ichthyophaga TaxID=245174 RepID=A0A4T0GJN6_WALIC|nr:hypothetical protein E3P91_02351 [Wallemia ichthyophaga]TIA81213.1 hypothetical protein E3P98_02157 [Wallemia ichthyophaga]TIA90905.1 hypothetical protein E3P97_02281 [Wallemia ichthyophaga]TIA99802.1 hypothetical protein E3P95_01905 [Wallemia ichthyophaga]TIB00807.1 hypothetical protein E3P94_02029 [Wallemia ichthyophaga]